MRFLLLAILSAALLACGDTKLHKTLPPNVHVDTYVQQGAAAVDVLWVVDNSGSMQPYQKNLGQNFDSFIKIFTRGSVDYRIAVTTSDIFHQKGQFQGNPAILSPQTPDVIGSFEMNVLVGTMGSANSEGLAAAELALGTQIQQNAQLQSEVQSCQQACGTDTNCQSGCVSQYPITFLRPGAYLYLVFVEDKNDQSPQDVRYYWRVYSESKGIGNDGTVTVATITGTQPVTPCGATLGQNFLDLAALTGGEYGSICDTSFADTLKKLSADAVGLKRKFALGQSPNVQTLSVTLKYPCNVSTDSTANCASTDASGCQGAAADALELVCTPVQGGTDGWAYEADTNVIYFAGSSVPDLHAEIDIQYYVAGTGP